MNMLFIVLILLAAVAIFSIQNAQTVSIKFLAWGTEASLAIVIIISVALGLFPNTFAVFVDAFGRF